MALKALDGHVIHHREAPGTWHLTRAYDDPPAGSRRGRWYFTHCDQPPIPILAAVMGELQPLGQPETGPLPSCPECIRRHLLAIQVANTA